MLKESIDTLFRQLQNRWPNDIGQLFQFSRGLEYLGTEYLSLDGSIDGADDLFPERGDDLPVDIRIDLVGLVT